MNKQILAMASWNFRLARRWYGLLCTVFAVQQLAVLLALAASTGYMRCTYAGLFYFGRQLYLFGAAFVGAGIVSARNLMQNRGRTHAAYLWLTLPQPRWAKLAAQALTALAMELGVLALQAVLYIAYYFPVAAVQRWRANQFLTQPMPADNLYEQVIRSNLMLVYPVSWPGMLLLALILIASSIMLPAIFLHIGWRRAGAAAMAVAGGFLGLGMIYRSQNLFVYTFLKETVFCGVLLVILALISWLWALRALRWAEPAL